MITLSTSGLLHRDKRRVPDKLICACYGVSEAEIREAIIVRGAETVADLRRMTGAGGGCGACGGCLRKMLAGRSSANDESDLCADCGKSQIDCTCVSATRFLSRLLPGLTGE